MSKVKITVLRKARYDDLIEEYENPIEHACDMREGDVFITDGYSKPEGMCESAWMSVYPFALTLASGGKNLYGGWMKDPKTALIYCNDGFRPVSFLLSAED